MDSAAHTLYEPYREALADGGLRITRCARCKRWQWYPLARCARCRHDEWEWADVPLAGTVHSWTRVHRPTVTFPGLEPPYVLALVELPAADGARIVALADQAASDPVIGDTVTLVPRPAETGTVLHFSPAVDLGSPRCT
jgi:uncharacterized OB-fold protein